MTRKIPTCIDCSCEAVSHVKTRHSRNLTTEEITFACGASQIEQFNAESGLGSVLFEGCPSPA
jgi:hypothetical protein